MLVPLVLSLWDVGNRVDDCRVWSFHTLNSIEVPEPRGAHAGVPSVRNRFLSAPVELFGHQNNNISKMPTEEWV
jgi:hypothetical protein